MKVAKWLTNFAIRGIIFFASSYLIISLVVMFFGAFTVLGDCFHLPDGGEGCSRMREFELYLALPAFVAGGYICLVNFYLFMRWAIYRLRGLPRESFRFISGISILGSLFVAVSLKYLDWNPALKIIGIALIIVDAGGIHWLIPGLIYQLIYRRKHK